MTAIVCETDSIDDIDGLKFALIKERKNEASKRVLGIERIKAWSMDCTIELFEEEKQQRYLGL